MKTVYHRALLSALLLTSSSLVASSVFAAASVGSDKADAIKGHNKVVIAEFGVEFYTQRFATATAGGMAGSSSSAIVATLTGVSDTTMQAITDQAYADTVTALKQAGFEVVEPTALLANPDYQKLAEKYGVNSPYQFNDKELVKGETTISKIFAPTGQKAYFSSGTARGDFKQRVDVQNQGRGMKEGELAKALGVTLLHVNYLANFVEPHSKKPGVLASLSSNAKSSIDYVPELVAEDTAFQFVTDAGARTFTTSRRPRHTGAVYLSDNLEANQNIFQSIESTSAESKKKEAIGNATSAVVSGLFSLATGSGIGGHNSKKVTYDVSPNSEEAFKQTYENLINQSATAMAAKLAQNK
ncbi:hypothetical protein QSV37_07775 [Acinetobacter sp. VNK23]|uniref:hypothetical protein n=1 Tax=Acinetobacter thutiue TaxID=2998078 RepID=UPI002574D4F9|nr:hypothetical protein [Acinetobacter thutiue]MDM1020204.1 hypothetical protein [Acinetobacter thutiue]